MAYTSRFRLPLCIAAWLFSLGSLLGQTFPIQIVNNSGLPDSEVFFFVKSFNPVTQNSQLSSFDSSGNVTLVDVSPSTNTANYIYPFSALPESGTLNFPVTVSARLYFSIQQPMQLYVTPVTSTVNGAPFTSYTIPEPNPFDKSDLNYYTMYDKVEFTYVNPGGSYINPTAVDFYGLPLTISQTNSTSGFTNAGITGSRNTTISDVQTFIEANDETQNDLWSRLIVKYTDPTGHESILRVISPSKAIIPTSNNVPYFDNTYLNNSTAYGFDYINTVNDYYLNNLVYIDCSELFGLFAMNNYTLTGQMSVSGNDYTFNFENDDHSYTFALLMPKKSQPFFAGAGETFNAINNTPPAIIVRQITSAFDAGLLPAPNNTVLNQDYFLSEKDQNHYYTSNPLLGNTTGTGPWYDLYSAALHNSGEPIYTFAYDDELGQDGTLHDGSISPSVAVVTLGNMTNTVIPNPYIDPNKYTVTPSIGQGSTVYYGPNYHDTKAISGVAIPNQDSPFKCFINGININVYLADGFVEPYFDGASAIFVNTTAPQTVTIDFPSNKGFPPQPITPAPTTTPTPTIPITPTPSLSMTATTTRVPSFTPVPTTVPSSTTTFLPSITTTPVPSATTTDVPSPTTTSVPSATTTEVPSATTTPVPSPTTTDVPSATNTPVPSPTTTDVPSATTTPVPSPTTTEVPSATNTPVPSPTTTDVPSATTTPVPSATITEVPSATTTPVPSATTTEVPSATTTPVPSATTTEVPSATTTLVPSPAPDGPDFTPSATTTPVPSPTTTEVPSPTITPVPSATTTEVPSTTTTPVPSATTTEVPSATTTPVPSPTTTEVPSATTTPVPSATTTEVPSATTTPVPSPTTTEVPSATTTPVPSVTTTEVPSATTTPVPSPTTTEVPSVTTTPVPSASTTDVPSVTTTPVPSNTSIPVPTVSYSPTVSATATILPTITPTPTPSQVPTPAPTGRFSYDKNLDGSCTITINNADGSTKKINIPQCVINGIYDAQPPEVQAAMRKEASAVFNRL